MTQDFNRRRVDASGQPIVVQCYNVPFPKYDQYHRHDSALYSLWNHFIEFCMKDAEDNRHSVITNDTFMNPFIQKRRLPVFIALAHSNDLA